MGRKREQRRNADQLDSSDDDSLSSTSTAMSDLPMAHETERVNSQDFLLEKYLDALYEKRASTREKALTGLVDAFSSQLLHGFVENKCITLLHQYLNSVKKGSSKEACLASRAIGLLAITVGAGDSAHEIMEESLPPLSLALKCGSDAQKKSSVLDCIALVTFVGAIDTDETENAMKIIWETIHPKSGTIVGSAAKLQPAVLAAAISAWSFLLTTMNGWGNNSDNWQESISFLSILLERDDRAVRIAAGEAIALIFEIGRLDKFSREEGETDSAGREGFKPRGLAYVASMKGKILNQVRELSAEAGGKGTGKKDLNLQRDLFQDILIFLETGECPEISMRISNNLGALRVTTRAQSIQLNFLKRFLASGFLKHMQDNELLHDVFSFTPGKKGNLSSKEKRMFMSPNSVVNKERTQMRNKYRSWAQDRNQGHYSVIAEDA
ncbi:interferon-related developmental regulator 2 isoform X1 [Dioscorea cayenensis subsp. rotundata]|uniref:Interferon-related developmental regulator 2 isoform X1 n=1 Tax=Dioscorea cayennensis subsp. rotundata TaxID=55577 RepID=A0AB40AJ25_DIOCR|nr:interferon-related developmental regulator 2 isoform X1 [Dioscorea cayenensis subsp. rotundata]